MAFVKVFSSPEEARGRLKQMQPQLLVAHGKRICLVLTGDGLHAVEDRCPHNGESLSKGTVNYMGEVICSWHGHCFNLKTGRESAERSRDLTVYTVLENADGVFVDL